MALLQRSSREGRRLLPLVVPAWARWEPERAGWPPVDDAAPAGQGRRWSSLPESTIYSGPQPPAAKRVTLRTIRQKYAAGEPLTMVTAYDYPSAVHVRPRAAQRCSRRPRPERRRQRVIGGRRAAAGAQVDAAGIDLLLVGDSVSMVVHGHDTTLPVTVDDMLLHCRAAARGARRPFLVGDLPFGSYEASAAQAVHTATRFLKDGMMDAVKLEGGGPGRAERVQAVVEAGIAVMGHTGLMPQSVSALGGFGPQGRTADSALLVIRDAIRLWRAGCFAIVLECVPPVVAAAVTRAVDVPTIGIGAGPHCSGQVLVYHDLLGMMQHPHHAKVTPKFCKQFAAVGSAIQAGLTAYNAEVKGRAFPSAQFSPYRISDEEVGKLRQRLEAEDLGAALEGLEAFQADSEPGG